MVNRKTKHIQVKSCKKKNKKIKQYSFSIKRILKASVTIARKKLKAICQKSCEINGLWYKKK